MVCNLTESILDRRRRTARFIGWVETRTTVDHTLLFHDVPPGRPDALIRGHALGYAIHDGGFVRRQQLEYCTVQPNPPVSYSLPLPTLEMEQPVHHLYIRTGSVSITHGIRYVTDDPV